MTDFDWEGDQPPAARSRTSIIYELHVRGFTASPPRRASAPRHLRRADREDPLPEGRSASPPSSSCRSFEFDEYDCPLRQPDRPASGCATPGATTRSPSSRPHGSYCVSTRAGRPASASSARWSRPSTRPASRSSSTSSSTTPARGTSAGPTISFRGLDNSIYYMLDPTTAVLHELHRLRQHAQLQPPGRPRSSSSTACGTGCARCTSTASGSTWRRSCRRGRGRRRRWTSRRSSGRSSSTTMLADTKLIAEPWDAGGPVPGRQLPGRPLGRVERPVPRRRPPLRARATPGIVGGAGHAARGSADLYQAERPRCRSTASTSSPATTASRSTTSSPTTTSTTRPTARATATAPTTT